ncbi:FAD-dependent oxidoreductase [Sphingosinicella rhizophila]|uniref:D-amino-acid oxidase n=1 Tax=Sphingosinicella rhizophila TaxID=3050082 RepID=A0ABU3QCI9_9SPHN|nr:FAD-dependent oxidoreductase [Sphingosinicella sp. GR2756]MDT9601007.1 FAD-dependent oxidoreductase [Sphingosinicella sp. GR2756]
MSGVGSALPDRRHVIRSAMLAAGGMAFSGCTTGGARPQRPGLATACLHPVKVSADRIIRTEAGLRPYRASGFVVRAEPVGAARVIHNYGHGGAGISLSWGSSKLATELGLPGHSGAVAVIGAGVMGLTTARLVQEAGFPVTVYAASLPPGTTSNIAGGQWLPAGHYREHAVTPEWQRQYRAAADYSWRRFQIMVGDDYGIRWLPTYTEADAPRPPLLPTFPPINRLLTTEEHPFPLESVVRFDTMYIEAGRFLRRLMQDIRIGGGSIQVRSFASPAEIAALPEKLVFNCTGLGARQLFGDEGMHPVRGQLAILLPQPEVDYAFMGDAGYMFPRADGIILGGTYEHGQWSPETDPRTIDGIIASHRHLFEAFRCSGRPDLPA